MNRIPENVYVPYRRLGTTAGGAAAHEELAADSIVDTGREVKKEEGLEILVHYLTHSLDC
tara:strand:- start:919 stop:1098 length:180 start_codon:yes stop_codon:yes gene_type:complete